MKKLIKINLTLFCLLTINVYPVKCLRIFITILFALILFNGVNAQTISVINPSFEGAPKVHIAPSPWENCLSGQTPDTQPGIWEISVLPTDGNSYLGLIDDGNSWQEGVSQVLSSPLISGTGYLFTIDLARSGPAGGGIVGSDVELLVYGGLGQCDKTELLWSSGNVALNWVTYNISFTPSADYTHIFLQCNALDGGQAYLLIDNMSDIVP